jgi:hypothetical protein
VAAGLLVAVGGAAGRLAAWRAAGERAAGSAGARRTLGAQDGHAATAVCTRSPRQGTRHIGTSMMWV